MSPGNDNQVDWTASAVPEGERLAASLSPAKPRPMPQSMPQSMTQSMTQSRRNVMDTLLGDNDLIAMDAGGSDPYNATGRLLRR